MRVPLIRSGTMALLQIALLGTYCAELRAHPQQAQTEVAPPASVQPQEKQAGQQQSATPAYVRPEEKPSVFRVKYVTEDTVYLAAGRNAGLQEGMKLSVVKQPPDGGIDNGIRFRGEAHVAELQLISVADTSSVCAVISTAGELRVGQVAFLTIDSMQEQRDAENVQDAEQYSTVIGFSYGDPLDDEVRGKEEKKILQESPVGRIRARLGFDYGTTSESGGFSSRRTGMLINADMNFIGGTYWNFNWYFGRHPHSRHFTNSAWH